MNDSYGAHEFGHESKLVFPLYYQITEENPSTEHYEYKNRPTPDTLDASSLLIMNDGFKTQTDVRLGKYGVRTWTQYDILHLRRQYTAP